MNARSDAMSQLLDQVNREVFARGFLVFPGRVGAEGPTAFWPVTQGIVGFLDLAASLGKRMVYVDSDALTPDDLIDAVGTQLVEVHEALDADTPEEFFELAAVSGEAEVKDFLRFGKEHYGRVTRVSVEWVNEGVVHRLWQYADWHVALMDKATEVADLIDALQSDSE